MRIGVDLGGSKIEAVALGRGGRELWRSRIPTPKNDYQGTVVAIASLVDRLEGEVGRRGSVGIGTPGSQSVLTGMMKNCNSTVLNGKPLQQDLTVALGREIRIANDANCFTLSEARDGAAAGEKSVFGVILGTGVGGGLVINGEVMVGANGIGGEWGHNPLCHTWSTDHNPRPCYCGSADCVETWLSGPGLEASFRQLTGQVLSAAKIVRLAGEGELQAASCYQSYVEMLARALAAVINIVDPICIVLGGGMSNTDSLYSDVMAIWDSYVFSDIVKTRLLKARHGDSSGVRGAAWLWPE